MTTTSLAVQPPALSVRRRWTVLAICALSLFLVGLDTTIVNVGLPSIGRGLSRAVREARSRHGGRTRSWLGPG